MCFLSKTKGRDCNLQGFTVPLCHHEKVAANYDEKCIYGPRIERVRSLVHCGVQLKASQPRPVFRRLLARIAGHGYSGTDQLRLREGIEVSRCVLRPEESYASLPSMRPDEQSFRRSVELLFQHQLPSGELPLFVSEKPDEYPGRYTKTLFLTAFQAALHADIPNATVRFVTQRSQRFLLQERSSDGLWRFFGRGSNIDADIDDTFAALCALRNDKAIRESLPGVIRQVRSLQDTSGLYRTWFTRAIPTCDLTVNANLLMFLSFLGVDVSAQERLRSALLRALLLGELPFSRYYLSPATLQFSLGNCMPAFDEDGLMLSTYFRDIAGTTSWFVQNSRSLFYCSPVVDAVFNIYNRYYPNSYTLRYT